MVVSPLCCGVLGKSYMNVTRGFLLSVSLSRSVYRSLVSSRGFEYWCSVCAAGTVDVSVSSGGQKLLRESKPCSFDAAFLMWPQESCLIQEYYVLHYLLFFVPSHPQSRSSSMRETKDDTATPLSVSERLRKLNVLFDVTRSYSRSLAISRLSSGTVVSGDLTVSMQISVIFLSGTALAD